VGSFSNKGGVVMTVSELKQSILKKIVSILKELLGGYEGQLVLEYPPSLEFGDYTINISAIAKRKKNNPIELAKNVASKLSSMSILKKVNAVGAYININVDKTVLFEIVLSESTKCLSGINAGKKVMVEYLSPNTNKPLHLGHVRNGVIGTAMANIFQATGSNVIKANLINDRGEHICRSMVAYKKWGNGETPESSGMKGDHFVGKWYVRYSQEVIKTPELNDEVHEMLKLWESGDLKTLKLWRTMNDWVYQGFNETCHALGFVFDHIYHESETYKLGKDIVGMGLEKDVFYRGDGEEVLFDLPEDEFGVNKDGSKKIVTLVRKDGTSVYITQDVGTALKKFKENNLDSSIYVVGSEQNYHFRCLFEILKQLKYNWVNRCHHLSYGMVYLPEGKMKSREGKVIDADALVDEMRSYAKQEILARKAKEQSTISEEELNDRASKIAIGAIKFHLLNVNPKQDIYFNPKESISFDGATGPYCQYAYVRAKSIIRKAVKDGFYQKEKVDFSLLGTKEEIELVHKLSLYPEVVAHSAHNFNCAQVAAYVYDLAKIFSKFYSENSVILAQSRELTAARILLVQVTSDILKNCLNLLGIETLEIM
jgi:arginyl-tRNA synthetase